VNFSQTGGYKPQNPVGLALDSQFLYVSDSKGNKVAVFDHEGKLLRFMADEKALEWPVGLAVDEKANLLFAVSGRKHAVVVLDRTSGRVLRTLGRQGAEPGQFNFPTYITTLPGERIAVVDTQNWRVQILTYAGRVVKVFGEIGDRPGQFSRPKGIAADSDGNLYVVDGSFNNIQVFSDDGRLLTFLGSFGEGKGQFHTPLGLSCQGDTLYVADQLNGRVQVLQYLSDGKGKG
jgi:DNA-binding beta-propeller fold protein YncE